eukprot:TRINITY_DN4844_c0_g4_i2.p2 TRINITY_DN4844_c0_g4~~TRINITY_DN4844_c0_g4_i2.p2  ORF type:complete len:782 (-),score=151.33 TRINITY_DN4844_c0_g4_i2:2341-4686(-)
MALKLRQAGSSAGVHQVFGIPLEDLISHSSPSTPITSKTATPSTASGGAGEATAQLGPVPRLVHDLAHFLKKPKCITKEKIMVREGDDITVQLLKKLYNRDGSVDLDKYQKSAVSVAAFFKLFFVELPDSLLTKRLASTFLKTHSNPDREKRLQFLRKLVSALPAAHKATLSTLLDVLRTTLMHRNRSRVSTNELCIEWGPVIVGGIDKSNLASVQETADLLKTLIVQKAYLLGAAEEPSAADEVPVVALKRRKTDRSGSSKSQQHSTQRSGSSSSKKGKTSSVKRSGSHKQHHGDGSVTPSSDVDTGDSDYASESDDDVSNVGLVDSVMSMFISSTIDHLLFDPRVRVSYAYEPKVPPNIKSLYTIDKLVESATTEGRSRSGSRIDILRDEFFDNQADGASSNLSSPRGGPLVGGRTPRRLSVSSVGDADSRQHINDSDSPRNKSPGQRQYTKSKSTDKIELRGDKKIQLNLAGAQNPNNFSSKNSSPRSPPTSDRSDDTDRASRDSNSSKLHKRASTGRVAHKSRLVLSSGGSSSGGTKKSKSEKDLHSHTVRMADTPKTRDGRASTVGETPSADLDNPSSDPNSPQDSRTSSINDTEVAQSKGYDADVAEAEDRESTSSSSRKAGSSSGRRKSVSKSRSSQQGMRNAPKDAAETPATAADDSVVPPTSPERPAAPIAPQDTTTTASLSSLLAEYEALKAEKKELQATLNAYKDEFVRKNGRTILYEDDKQAVQAEYDRYKVVKQLLAQIEAQMPRTAASPTATGEVDAAAVSIAVQSP